MNQLVKQQLHKIVYLKIHQENLLAVLVPVEHAVETDGDVAQDITAQRNVGTDCAAGADAEDGQAAMSQFGEAGIEIDIGQGVELGHHDVDVVGADAV